MSYASEVLADAPRYFYRLNENPYSGLMNDSSPNNNDGTYTLTYPLVYRPESVHPRWVRVQGFGGVGDQALEWGPHLSSRIGMEDAPPVPPPDFEGSTGQAKSPSFAPDVAFTIEGFYSASTRIPTEAYTWGHCKIGKTSNFGISWQFTLTPLGGFYSTGVRHNPTNITDRPSIYGTTFAFTPPPYPARVHWAWVHDMSGGNVTDKVYIDGVLLLNNTSPQDGSYTYFDQTESGNLFIEGQNSILDEIAYYPVALSAARIAAHSVAAPVIITAYKPSTLRLPTMSGAVLRNPVRITAGGAAVPRVQVSAELNIPTLIGGAIALPSPAAVGEITNIIPAGRLPRPHTVGRMYVGMDDAIPVAVVPSVISTTSDMGAGATVTHPFRVRTSTVSVRSSVRFATSNPDTPVYRLLVVNQAGVPQTELAASRLGPVPWAVTGVTTYGFDVAADASGAEFIQEWRSEIQVWRNDRLLWWGVVIRASSNGKVINVQCADLGGYFSRRVIGRVPKKNLLGTRAPGEPANIAGWSFRSLPRSGDGGPPAMSTTTEDSYNDQSAMRLSSSAGRKVESFSNDNWYTGISLTAAGKKSLRTILDKMAAFTSNRPALSVEVYDDNVLGRDASDDRARDRAEAVADYVLDQYPRAKVSISAPAYRKPLNNNGTPEKREDNRRTVVSYKTVDGSKGHKQHATQSVILRNPGPKERKQVVTFSTYVNIENEVGWAAEMKGVEVVRSDPRTKHPDERWEARGYFKPVQTTTIPFGDGVQPGVWFRVEASVILPNNGKRSHIEVRLFPPNGDALFSEMWLTKEEALTFRQKEQADIIKALITHAQDPDMGKSDLNISTNIAKTGVKRTRDYPFSERAKILDLLEEFPKLGNGVEWRIVPAGDQRIFTTYYPRMGNDTTVVLASGSNVVSYGVASDGSLLATTVVIQAPTGEGHSREERAVQDPSLMDGLVLEQVYTGTPNSPASSWRRQAERGLARYRRPVVIPDVTLSPAATSELLETVFVGDRVTTDISSEVENIDVFQKARVTEIFLDPNTDSLRYTLTPEDINIVTLAQFNSPVKYLSQPQNPIVGASGVVPVESNVEYASRAFNDAGWSTGTSVGWVKEATGTIIRNPQHIPSTTVPDNHEVWIRKWVQATGDMVLTVRVADWGYVYVNGHRVGRSHFDGYNVLAQVAYVNLRIPAAWLDPSGNQLVAVHAQFDPARRSSNRMDSLYADVSVRGTFNPDEIA